MTSFVVMEPGSAGPEVAREQAILVPEKTSVAAFLFPPLWFVWHRMPLEALFALAAMAVLAALGETTVPGAAVSALSLGLSLYVAMEGPALRVAALRRRGWREAGLIVAENAAEAELRHAAANATAEPVAVSATPAPPPPHRDRSGRLSPPSGPAPGVTSSGLHLGLLGAPGR